MGKTLGHDEDLIMFGYVSLIFKSAGQIRVCVVGDIIFLKTILAIKLACRIPVISILLQVVWEGVQWLSGRVLDSRPRVRRFEPHRCHYVLFLEQDTFILA